MAIKVREQSEKIKLRKIDKAIFSEMLKEALPDSSINIDKILEIFYPPNSIIDFEEILKRGADKFKIKKQKGGFFSESYTTRKILYTLIDLDLVQEMSITNYSKYPILRKNYYKLREDFIDKIYSWAQRKLEKTLDEIIEIGNKNYRCDICGRFYSLEEAYENAFFCSCNYKNRKMSFVSRDEEIKELLKKIEFLEEK